MKTASLTLFLLLFLFSTVGAQSAEQQGVPVRFAIVGDFGSGDENELAVANLIDSWDVDFLITTGDNYYLAARGFGGNGFNQYDNSVGRFYCPYLKDIALPNSGTLDCPPELQSQTANRFFPTLGNHDRTDTQSQGISTYLDYFTLPGEGFENSSGSERYYDFVQGPVHFFAIDSDTARRDESDLLAQQSWLREAMLGSTSPWQIVYFHQAAFSSSNHGVDIVMQWPFAEWGADAVFQGHDHVYERILRDDIVYLVSGSGGKDLYEFETVVAGSVVRYDGGYGAVLVSATDETLDFEAWAVDDERQDMRLTTPVLVDLYHLTRLRNRCSTSGKAIFDSGDDAVLQPDSQSLDLTGPNPVLVEGDHGLQWPSSSMVSAVAAATLSIIAGERPPALSLVYCPTPAIGGEVWVDTNENGRHDVDERLRAGARVQLWDPGVDGEVGSADDRLIGSTRSGNQGYGFYDVGPGPYFVTFEKPDRFRFAVPGVIIMEEGWESAPDPGSRSTEIFTYIGAPLRAVDAALIPDPPKIEAPVPNSQAASLGGYLPWIIVPIMSIATVATGIYVFWKYCAAERSRW